MKPKRNFRVFAAMLIAVAMMVSTVATPLVALAQDVTSAPKVTAIMLRGNDHVSNDVIFDAITHTKIGEPYNPEAVLQDLEEVFALGMFQDLGADPQPFQDGVRVVFHLVEMPIVKSFTVKSDVVGSHLLAPYFSVEVGKILNRNTLQEDISDLYHRTSGDLGYILEVSDADISDDGDVVLTTVAHRVGEIRVEGNEKTKDHVIKREIRIDPGSVLQVREIQQSTWRIFQLGFFEDVNVELRPTDEPHVVDLVFQVEERKTGNAAFGAGYSSADGILGYIELAEENLFGRGQRAHLRWEFAARSNEYDLGFYEPYLDRHGTSLGFNIYRRTSERTFLQADKTLLTYDHKQLGGDLTLGRRLTDYTRVFTTYRMENYDIIPRAAGDVEEQLGRRVRSLTLGLNTNTTDSPFYPTSGFRYNLQTELAGGLLGGDDSFTKYQAAFSKYLRVGRNDQVLAMRVSTGMAGATPLPSHEKFRIGGSETLRGYKYGEFQGDKMAFANLEYRFKITDKVQGVVFGDAGQAFDHTESINLGSLKTGVGVGIRLDTPLGTMRVDYGVGDKGGNAYFSLGQSF